MLSYSLVSKTCATTPLRVGATSFFDVFAKKYGVKPKPFLWFSSRNRKRHEIILCDYQLVALLYGTWFCIVPYKLYTFDPVLCNTRYLKN